VLRPAIAVDHESAFRRPRADLRAHFGERLVEDITRFDRRRNAGIGTVREAIDGERFAVEADEFLTLRAEPVAEVAAIRRCRGAALEAKVGAG
jgi:hypothetical protein